MSFNTLSSYTLIIMLFFWLNDNLIDNDWFTGITVGLIVKVDAVKCFTCDGRCFTDTHCNCQTGMCVGEYCFAERRMIKDNEYYLRKGCARGRVRLNSECEQYRPKQSVLCYCKHSDFCNNEIIAATDVRATKNVTCNKCKSTTNVAGCQKYCHGDYCWVNNDNAYLGSTMDCGYSSLSLQYHDSSPNLLYAGSRHPLDQAACFNFKGGSTKRVQECVCNNNQCNYKNLPDNSLTVIRRATAKQELLTCYSCDETASDQAVSPSSCKSNTCQGQFCVLSIENQAADRDQLFFRTAGCLNSSRPLFVKKGCVQRWTLKKWEKIDCVCQKDFCNQDVSTAEAVDVHSKSKHSYMIFLFVLCYLLL